MIRDQEVERDTKVYLRQRNRRLTTRIKLTKASFDHWYQVMMAMGDPPLKMLTIGITLVKSSKLQSKTLEPKDCPPISTHLVMMAPLPRSRTK